MFENKKILLLTNNLDIIESVCLDWQSQYDILAVVSENLGGGDEYMWSPRLRLGMVVRERNTTIFYYYCGQ